MTVGELITGVAVLACFVGTFLAGFVVGHQHGWKAATTTAWMALEELATKGLKRL